MLYLALSCLQGRPMQSAAEELSALAPDGLQLTPGNVPTPDFWGWLSRSGVRIVSHHGFSATAYRARVWNPDGELNVSSASVHPPRDADPAAIAFQQRETPPSGVALETMYPGYALGTGAQLERAMDASWALAIDISHVFMQRTQGVMTERTWNRLQEYPHVVEVHVSANAGHADTHRPIDERTFGLDWARARLRAGTPTVLESYMHRMSHGERARQLELLRW